MAFIFATGGIDLSVSSMISLGAIILGSLTVDGIAIPAAMGITFLTLGIVGGLNGLLIHLTKINAFIITLASSSIFGGLGLVITQGVPISRFPQEMRFFGFASQLFSPSVICAIIFFIGALIVGHFTKWGLYLRMIGSNRQNLQRTGVKTLPYLVSVYALMGITATLIGLILMTKLNSAEVNIGGSLGMDAITAVILGGATLKGGEFKLCGTFLAVFLLSIVRVGLTASSVSSYYQDLVVGVILLVAVVLSNVWSQKDIN